MTHQEPKHAIAEYFRDLDGGQDVFFFWVDNTRLVLKFLPLWDVYLLLLVISQRWQLIWVHCWRELHQQNAVLSRLCRQFAFQRMIWGLPATSFTHLDATTVLSRQMQNLVYIQLLILLKAIHKFWIRKLLVKSIIM